MLFHHTVSYPRRLSMRAPRSVSSATTRSFSLRASPIRMTLLREILVEQLLLRVAQLLVLRLTRKRTPSLALDHLRLRLRMLLLRRQEPALLRCFLHGLHRDIVLPTDGHEAVEEALKLRVAHRILSVTRVGYSCQNLTERSGDHQRHDE